MQFVSRGHCLTSLALAVLLVSGCGDRPAGEHAGAPAPESEVRTPPQAAGDEGGAPTIDGWLDSVGEGLRLAQRLRRPVLVYVCPDPEGCPAARHLDASLFAAAGARALGAEVVPVRLRLDQALDETSDAVLRRLGLRLHPAVGILSADGAVLHRQYAGLYPAFDGEGRVMPGDWGPLLDVESLLGVAREAVRHHAEVSRRARPPRGRRDAAAAVARALALAELGRAEEGLALLEEVDAEGAGAQLGAALARLLEEAERGGEAAARYEQLAAEHPEHGDAELWRYRAAHLRLLAAAASADGERVIPAALEQLQGLWAQAQTERVRLSSALSLAEHFRRQGDERRLRTLLDELAARVGTADLPPAAWSAPMLFRLAGLEAVPDPVLVERSEAHCRMLIRAFPDSFEAQQIKHGMLGLLRTMGAVPPAQPDGGVR